MVSPEPKNQSTAPLVVIILVSFKGLKDTMACLESLSHLTYERFKVVLVEQNSGDGTPAAVRAQYPQVQVIENPVNNGFTGGNNVGLKWALTQNPDYLFLLNNDTTVEPALLEKLLAPMQADPRLGIIGPAMLYYSEPETIWWAGGQIDWRGRSVHFQNGQSIKSLPEQLCETDYVCGCGMFIRRAVVDQVGLLDDRFFIYYEEADFCARTHRAGWKMALLPTACLWHKISKVCSTLGNEFGAYHWHRNRMLYLWKNAGWLKLPVCLYALASNLRLAATFFRQGDKKVGTAILRGIRDSLTGRWGGTFFSYKRPALTKQA